MNKTSSAITMALTSPEAKLILRLRQLRNSRQTGLFLVTTNPLALSVMGEIELLETARVMYTSGSGPMG